MCRKDKRQPAINCVKTDMTGDSRLRSVPPGACPLARRHVQKAVDRYTRREFTTDPTSHPNAGVSAGDLSGGALSQWPIEQRHEAHRAEHMPRKAVFLANDQHQLLHLA